MGGEVGKRREGEVLAEERRLCERGGREMERE